MRVFGVFASLFVIFAHAHVIMDVGTYVPFSDTDALEQTSPLQYFSPKVKIQSGGTCGTFSAVSLVEAHCKRFVDIDVNISESYQIYRVINDQLRDENGKVVVDAYNQFLSESSWPERDFPERVLKRIKGGSVCTQDEFQEQDSSNFVDFTRSSFQSLHRELVLASAEAAKEAGKKSLSGGEEDVRNAAVSEAEKRLKDIGSEVMSRIEHRAEQSAQIEAYTGDKIEGFGLKLKTKDLDLKQCVASMGEIVKVENPSVDYLKEWIDADFPVVCVFKDPDNISSNVFTEYLYSKSYQKPHHATVIYGYRESKTRKRVEFLVRDSNYDTVPAYSVSGCDTMIALQPVLRSRDESGEEASATP